MAISLAQIRQRFEDSHKRGDTPDAALLCRDCPELLDEVRRLLPTWKAGGIEDGASAPGEFNPPTWSLSPDSAHSGQRGAAHLSLQIGLELVPGFRLVQPIGKGAFGEVWEATGPGGVRLALKILAMQRGATPELNALELMKNIRHPHLVSLFGYWELANTVVIAMELADGTLLDRMRECRNQGLPGIPPAELVHYMSDAARGIDFLNDARHIQHRDIKPQNLLLIGGSVKVADFGLAKLLEETVAAHSGAMTPSYAAPECFHNETTRFSDQYSLAVTYYQLRTGKLPFEGSPAVVMAGHLTKAPDLSGRPAAERSALERALAKEPGKRWPTCQAFVGALVEMAKAEVPAAAKPKRSPIFDEPTRLAPVPVLAEPTQLAPMPTPAPTKAHPESGWGRTLFRFLLGLAFFVFAIGCPAVIFIPGFGKIEPKKEPKKALNEKKDDPPPIVKTEGPKTTKEPPGWKTAMPEPKTKVVEKTPPVPTPGPKRGDTIIAQSVGMKLVYIPPGKFTMGSPKSEQEQAKKDGDFGWAEQELRHDVEITKGFYLGVYTVTQQEYEKVMDKNPSWFSAGGGGKDKVVGSDTRRFPVETVSWDDAKEFCRKLSQKEGKTYRLPTEAEWEYACRAGTKTAFHFGDTISTDQANYNGNFVFGAGKKGAYRERTTEVGFFAAANGFGLHDMHGNVYQWCEDWYDGDYYRNSPKTDPLNTKAATYRVLRGSNWSSLPWFCRSAFRGLNLPDYSSSGIGFRVVLSSP